MGGGLVGFVIEAPGAPTAIQPTIAANQPTNQPSPTMIFWPLQVWDAYFPNAPAHSQEWYRLPDRNTVSRHTTGVVRNAELGCPPGCHVLTNSSKLMHALDDYHFMVKALIDDAGDETQDTSTTAATAHTSPSGSTTEAPMPS